MLKATTQDNLDGIVRDELPVIFKDVSGDKEPPLIGNRKSYRNVSELIEPWKRPDQQSLF